MTFLMSHKSSNSFPTKITKQHNSRELDATRSISKMVDANGGAMGEILYKYICLTKRKVMWNLGGLLEALDGKGRRTKYKLFFFL